MGPKKIPNAVQKIKLIPNTNFRPSPSKNQARSPEGQGVIQCKSQKKVQKIYIGIFEGEEQRGEVRFSIHALCAALRRFKFKVVRET